MRARHPRSWWVAASGLVFVAVVIAAVLGTASPTSQATLPVPTAAAKPTPVRSVGSGTSTVVRPGHSVTTTTASPSTTLPAAGPSTTVPPTTTAPTTTVPPVPPGDVGIQVTGTGQASMTVVDGDNQSQVNDVVLPWSTTLTDSPSSVNVSVQSSDGSATATVACAIDGPGITPVTNSSSGPFATVSCDTTLGP